MICSPHYMLCHDFQEWESKKGTQTERKNRLTGGYLQRKEDVVEEEAAVEDNWLWEEDEEEEEAQLRGGRSQRHNLPSSQL